MIKKMKWILPIAAVLLIIAIWLIHFFHTKTRFNDTYVNGNTAGNLYNGGMFCEYDGTVYFANPDDNYRLYSMSLNGDDVKKLSNDTATFINADEHYIYYARNNKAENSDFSFLRWNNNSLCRINRVAAQNFCHNFSLFLTQIFGKYFRNLIHETEGFLPSVFLTFKMIITLLFNVGYNDLFFDCYLFLRKGCNLFLKLIDSVTYLLTLFA